MDNQAFTSDGGPLKLHCIGVQFQDVPAHVRDAIALSPAEVSEALASITVSMPGAEAIVLATCNRTELYVVEAGDPFRLDVWHRTVGHRLGDDDACPADLAARFHLTGIDAAEHLLRVTAGLESAQLGDAEIAGQVRRARSVAVDAGTVGPVLHRLFDIANGAGRRARTETLIGAGGAGVGLATANEIASRGTGSPLVTVIGAGEAGNAVCREVTKRLGASLCIVNRTRSSAETLAGRYGGSAFGLEALVDALVPADVVVTALHGDRPVIDDALVAAVRSCVPGWSPLVIDTSVPRMVDAADLDVVHLDDLVNRERELQRVRHEAVPAVESIVADAVARFATWFRERAMCDVVAELYREAEVVTREAAGLVDDERAAREIQRAVRRLVHQHLSRLRTVEASAEGHPRKEQL